MDALKVRNSSFFIRQERLGIFESPGYSLKENSNIYYTIKLFRKAIVIQDAINNVPTPLFEEFCLAAIQLSELYPAVLGENYLCRMLKNDMINNASFALEIWKKESPNARSVEEFLLSQLNIHTLDFVKSNQHNAIMKFLWTVRAVNFIHTFIENLTANSGEDTNYSAREAYNKSLRPFHGFVKVGIAIMAFKLIPPKAELIRSLGLPDTDSGLTTLKNLTRASKPCIDQINFLLEKYGCNFRNKV
ncbi:glycolipid transfer protein GLTP [Cryptosporidium felis]|nr:glycolipid transfer protein GLTP [Cryptosporidium felis]